MLITQDDATKGVTKPHQIGVKQEDESPLDLR